MIQQQAQQTLTNDRCKGCGRPIVWGIAEGGKKIPMDPSAPVYRVTNVDADGVVHVERATLSMVSHFTTCSAANDFSASQKRHNTPGGRIHDGS